MYGTLNRLRGRSAQDFVSRYCTTTAYTKGVGLSQPGGPSPTLAIRYHPLQGLANLHSDGGGCNYYKA